MTTSMPPCDMVAFKDHITVTLRPEIVQSSWTDIESFGGDVRAELERRTHPACVVDLSPLNYMGSAIVALIVRIWKVVQERKGKMVVVCKNPGVRELLELAGLDKIWTIAPEVSAAHKKLGVKLVESAPVPRVAIDASSELPGHFQEPAEASSSSQILYFVLGMVTVLIALVVVLLVVVLR